jgi:D-lactate dehydrogenase
MKVAVYSTHKFERNFLVEENGAKHELLFLDVKLDAQTFALAEGCQAISVFVSDDISSSILRKLHNIGVKYIALRSAGFNHLNLETLHELKLRAARVPAYSPYSVAEHATALMLALNRKLIRANNRVNELNFSLDGLTGFDMHGKTAGIVGTGKIGSAIAHILHGFGCNIIAYDKIEQADLKDKLQVKYVDFKTLCQKSDIITLHVPLTPETKYLVNSESIASMKDGVMLINTSRGLLVNTRDVIDGLKTGKIGYFGMDVYEEEEHLFFEDHSGEILRDEVIGRLMTFKNVLITGHQAFLTNEALRNIAATTIYNLDCFSQEIITENQL